MPNTKPKTTAAKKPTQNIVYFICNLLAFNLFIVSLHLFCGQTHSFIFSSFLSHNF